MSIYDLQAWLGTPCIFVFDCSAAGLIVNSFKAFAEQKPQVSFATALDPLSTEKDLFKLPECSNNAHVLPC